MFTMSQKQLNKISKAGSSIASSNIDIINEKAKIEAAKQIIFDCKDYISEEQSIIVKALV